MGKRKPDHAVRKHIDQRPITTIICDQEDCKFFGKAAQQGVCHTTDGDVVEFAKIEAHERQILAEMKSMKRREHRRYTQVLEAYYLCAMLNWQIMLDECIRLRRDLALARVRSKRRG